LIKELALVLIYTPVQLSLLLVPGDVSLFELFFDLPLYLLEHHLALVFHDS
jgi:hypothetical protein